MATAFCLMEYIINQYPQKVPEVFKRIVTAWTKSEETVQKERRPLNPSAGTDREVAEKTTQRQTQAKLRQRNEDSEGRE